MKEASLRKVHGQQALQDEVWKPQVYFPEGVTTAQQNEAYFQNPVVTPSPKLPYFKEEPKKGYRRNNQAQT